MVVEMEVVTVRTVSVDVKHHVYLLTEECNSADVHVIADTAAKALSRQK